MTCGTCGALNPAGHKFCGECGARLALACAACGTALDPSQKFCGECGARTGAGPVSAEGPAAASPVGNAAPTAERRLVSVLFADLVGFTPFSEERDSEEVRETLTRYFDVAQDVIQQHGGTVEKFIGDAVMAVWGTPVAREDDAERSVRAALELLTAVAGMGDGIMARAGVMTGEAAVTLGAVNQGMVAGDIVNTAARVQSVAAPGTVLVGEATFRAASAAIAFEEAGARTLKGKDEAVATWRALRVIAERGGRGRADGLEAPFVGRDNELRTLKEAFHATGREGRARLVSVTGPAGIGKSRLAWEFEKYLDGVVETVWWHHGRSPAHGDGITFWALGEMLRSRCRLAETADEPTTRAAVDAMLETHFDDPAERVWVRPAVLALLGVEGERVAPDELFARWRLLFERLAATGTVALVFEDLHWADSATLDFIDHLLDWCRQQPILIVTLARPELMDSRPDWGAGRRSFIAVALDPLPEPAMRALLAGLVPDLPEPAVRQIVGRAEGIPLYAVETVRMLVADKRLVQDESVYKVVSDISSLAVPETLTALISARLDVLEPGDRSLVMDAAVLGQQFTLDSLGAVSGVDAAELEPRLRSLVRRELFTIQADPRSPERGQYGFVQGLIREVAYNTLARRDRKDRHLAAARHYERVGSDELAGALAAHYLAAHANASEGPEADALATQARLALRGAAERAAALGSHDQAASLLRQALTVTVAMEDRADLLERLGIALTASGHYTDAIARLEEARDIELDQDDRPAAARITRVLGECVVNSKQVDDAQRVLEEAAAAYADLADDPSVLGIKAQLARAYALLDRNRESIAMADEVLEEAEHANLVGIVADALITKGTALASIGRLHEGAALVDLGGRLAEEHGLVITRFRALNNKAVVVADSDPLEGLRATQQGLALARKVGNAGWTRAFIGNLGYATLRTGEWQLGEAEMRAALEDELEPGDAILILNNLITIVSSRGEDATALLRRLEVACEGLPEQQVRPILSESRAAIVLVEGDHLGAAALQRASAGDGVASGAGSLVSAALLFTWARRAPEAREALDALDALHLHQPALDAQRDAVEAAIGVLEGRADGAAGRLVSAYRRLAALHLPDDAGRVAITAAMLIGTDDPEVAAILADTRAFYERVGAAALLRIIEPMLPTTEADTAEAALTDATPTA